MYNPLAPSGARWNFLITFLYLSMLRYYFNYEFLIINYQLLIKKIAQSNYNFLRWLLRRGSPLPIPNRVVKPACADGTAVMWESMSSPFFMKLQLVKVGVFLFYTWSPLGFLLLISNVAFSFAQSGIALKSFENPSSLMKFFLFLILCVLYWKIHGYSSPDSSKLPCSADSGTTYVQNVK